MDYLYYNNDNFTAPGAINHKWYFDQKEVFIAKQNLNQKGKMVDRFLHRRAKHYATRDYAENLSIDWTPRGCVTQALMFRDLWLRSCCRKSYCSFTQLLGVYLMPRLHCMVHALVASFLLLRFTKSNEQKIVYSIFQHLERCYMSD